MCGLKVCRPPLAPSKVPASQLKLPFPLICNGPSLGKPFPCSFCVSWVILSLLCEMSQKNQNKESKEQGAEPGKPSATNKEQNRNCSWSLKYLLPSAEAKWEKKKLQFTHKEHIWFPLLYSEISFLCVCEKQVLQGRSSPQGRELITAMFLQKRTLWFVCFIVFGAGSWTLFREHKTSAQLDPNIVSGWEKPLLSGIRTWSVGHGNQLVGNLDVEMCQTVTHLLAGTSSWVVFLVKHIMQILPLVGVYVWSWEKRSAWGLDEMWIEKYCWWRTSKETKGRQQSLASPEWIFLY